MSRELLTQKGYMGVLSSGETAGRMCAQTLISYIGMDGLTQMDVAEEEDLLENGDLVLLCSDGWYHALRDDEIEATLRAYDSRLTELPGLLTRMAHERDWILPEPSSFWETEEICLHWGRTDLSEAYIHLPERMDCQVESL